MRRVSGVPQAGTGFAGFLLLPDFGLQLLWGRPEHWNGRGAGAARPGMANRAGNALLHPARWLQKGSEAPSRKSDGHVVQTFNVVVRYFASTCEGSCALVWICGKLVWIIKEAGGCSAWQGGHWQAGNMWQGA